MHGETMKLAYQFITLQVMYT